MNSFCNSGEKTRSNKKGEPEKYILKPKAMLDYNDAKN